jgi:hypothetical protein
MSTPDLNRIVAKIEDLPTLPRTVLKITDQVFGEGSGQDYYRRPGTDGKTSKTGKFLILWLSAAHIHRDRSDCSAWI